MYLTLAMHPELLNNSVFLRYYKKWQDDPDSIVFASIAEFLMNYDMVEDAFKVCREGLKRNSAFVSGHIIMAKIHKYRGNWEEAEEELRTAIALAPDNSKARAMFEEVVARKKGEDLKVPVPSHYAVNESASVNEHKSPDSDGYNIPEPWKTVTMADIFASQGHVEKAKRIYRSILETNPSNEAARRGMEKLS